MYATPYSTSSVRSSNFFSSQRAVTPLSEDEWVLIMVNWSMLAGTKTTCLVLWCASHTRYGSVTSSWFSIGVRLIWNWRISVTSMVFGLTPAYHTWLLIYMAWCSWYYGSTHVVYAIFMRNLSKFRIQHYSICKLRPDTIMPTWHKNM